LILIRKKQNIIFSSKDEKGVLTSSLLNEVLGKGPNIKWSAGSNRLQRAAQAVADSPCLVSLLKLPFLLNFYLFKGFIIQSSLYRIRFIRYSHNV